MEFKKLKFHSLLAIISFEHVEERARRCVALTIFVTVRFTQTGKNDDRIQESDVRDIYQQSKREVLCCIRTLPRFKFELVARGERCSSTSLRVYIVRQRQSTIGPVQSVFHSEVAQDSETLASHRLSADSRLPAVLPALAGYASWMLKAAEVQNESCLLARLAFRYDR